MKIEELKEKLELNNVPSTYYNLTGKGLDDDMTCLTNSAGKWQVYYTERGAKFGFQEFDNEDDACAELLRRMLD